jgi:rubrerythrin
VARRIKELGGEAETASVPGPEPVGKGVRAVKAAAQQAVAGAQGPLHAVRGEGPEERMLKNARTEFHDEAEEIANYRTIEALAKAVGDKDTAKLAREIHREEKRMSDFLAGMIDELAATVVAADVPEGEIQAAPATRSRPAKSRPAKSRAAKPRAAKARA